MSESVLTFDAYCTKFELDPDDTKSKQMYDVYKDNIESSDDDSIFNANSGEKVQGKDTLFD